jgi:hypothetical protein
MTAVQRMRRCRARQRAGRRTVLLDIDVALIEDALLRTGFLSRADSDDQVKVDAALREAVDAWSKEKIARCLLEDDKPDRLLRVTTKTQKLCDTAAMNSRK